MHKGKWRYVKAVRNRRGYMNVNLHDGNNNRCSQKVHRLVLRAWKGPSSAVVNHKNGIKDDNRLDNLEYCTVSENNKHAWINGYHERTRAAALLNKGQENGSAKLTEKQVKRLLELRDILTQNEAAKLFDISRPHVSDIWTGKKWKYLQEIPKHGPTHKPAGN